MDSTEYNLHPIQCHVPYSVSDTIQVMLLHWRQ